MSNQEKLLRIYNEQDETGKELVFIILSCTVTGGDLFFKEMQAVIDQGNEEYFAETIRKWVKKLQLTSKQIT